MSSTSRPSSPQLPTFGIRQLAGPAGPPGLISISRSQYDSTLKSQPDAALLYIDDDDGEVITVGSSLELSQRLEEPVPIWTRTKTRHGSVINKTDARNPCDGRLVHVFDITHTTASLAEWRAHEAYSSKSLRPSGPHPGTLQENEDVQPISEGVSKSIASTPDNLSEPQKGNPENEKRQIPVQRDSVVPVNVDIISGIEEHLSGLADVLLLAANTLQKAADKTRETDTSIVEDILYGVKGILTEVGSFGVDVLKEITKDTNEQDAVENAESRRGSKEAVPVSDDTISEVDISAGKSNNVQACNDIAGYSDTPVLTSDMIPDSLTSKSTSISSPRVGSVSSHSSKRSSRVTFDDHEIRFTPSDQSTIHEHGSWAPLSDKGKQKEVGRTSILDEPSEDADFTARYPPLNSVRRTRSTIDPRSIAPTARVDDLSRAWSPPVPPRSGMPEKKEVFDAPRRSLPGAWPDIKHDATPAESSGAFFNRMTGRVDADKKIGGLHRANTTSSANPASRLTGPFDPGFAYQPLSSAGVALRKGSTPAWNPYRRPFGPSGNGVADVERSPREGPLRTRRSVAYFGTPNLSKITSNVDNANSATLLPKYEPPRGFKHYRSVPNFDHITQNSQSETQALRPITIRESSPMDSPPRVIGNTARYVPPRLRAPIQPLPLRAPPRFADALSARPDFLTGPSPSHPPPIPFTARPVVPSSAAVPPTAPSFTKFVANHPGPVSHSPPHFHIEQRSHSPPASIANRSVGNLSETEPAVNGSSVSKLQSGSLKNKFDDCVEQLKMCGFGIDDDNLRDRLHVYAVAADGDIEEAVEMIEEDRRMSSGFN